MPFCTIQKSTAKFLTYSVVSRLGEHQSGLWLAAGYSIVIVLAIFLRLSLALVNREANDDHFAVIQLLSTSWRHLTMEDCRECFHPKLYYASCASIIKMLDVNDEDSQIAISQILNALVGVATLAVLLLALNNREPPQPTGCLRYERLSVLLAFSWIALNPQLIATNCQVSNDSFAVLFTSLALYAAQRLLIRENWLDFWCMLTFLCCAVLSKATSWPAGVAIAIVLIGRWLCYLHKACTKSSIANIMNFEPKLPYTALVVCTFVAVCLCIKFGGYDFSSYESYFYKSGGQPLYMFERTIVDQPGVISIADSYLTFQLVNLIKHPMNSSSRNLEPQHRASVWTQLYGRFNCIQFAHHPKSWQTSSELVKNVNRLVLLLSLSWLIAFAIGLAAISQETVAGIRMLKWDYIAHGENFLFPLAAIGYLAFIVAFTCSYRGYHSMNPVYVLPGLIAFTWILCRGYLGILRWSYRQKPRILTAMIALHCLLLASYLVNIELLIWHLQETSTHVSFPAENS